MRKRVRRIIVGLLVLVLAVGVGIVARNLWQQSELDLALEMIERLPDVAQRIKNFHRVKVDGDRKVWEVSAVEARYFDEEGVVAVEDTKVAVYFDEGRTVAMRARNGKVYLEGKELTKVEVEGGIEVDLDQYELSTDFARYEAASERIVAPGAVRLENEQVEFDGVDMVVDLDEQRLRINGGVQMLLWPRS